MNWVESGPRVIIAITVKLGLLRNKTFNIRWIVVGTGDEWSTVGGSTSLLVTEVCNGLYRISRFSQRKNLDDRILLLQYKGLGTEVLLQHLLISLNSQINLLFPFLPTVHPLDVIGNWHNINETETGDDPSCKDLRNKTKNEKNRDHWPYIIPELCKNNLTIYLIRNFFP